MVHVGDLYNECYNELDQSSRFSQMCSRKHLNIVQFQNLTFTQVQEAKERNNTFPEWQALPEV